MIGADYITAKKSLSTSETTGIDGVFGTAAYSENCTKVLQNYVKNRPIRQEIPLTIQFPNPNIQTTNVETFPRIKRDSFDPFTGVARRGAEDT